MINPETIAKVDAIIATLNETDAMFIQGMVNKIDELNRKLAKQEERLVEYSWYRNPDKSGGQFTQDEINRSGYQGEL
jgi:hypothetical protein